MRWRLPMRPYPAQERPLDPVRAWTDERERVHRARALRLVSPVVPPLLVSLLVIAGFVPVPRNLPEIALWLVLAALYARMWIFLVRDARRLAREVAAVDRRFRDLIGGDALDDEVPLRFPVIDGGLDVRAARSGSIIALVGRPIDERGTSARRFPLTAVGDVRSRLDRYLARIGASAVVCSAASGADLLALDVAEARNVRRRVVLPYDRARFRNAEVTNRPGTWGPLFDRVLRGLPSQDVITLAGAGANDDIGGSEVVNAAILDQAASLAAAHAPAARSASGKAADHGASTAARAMDGEPEVVAVLVWEGGSPGLAAWPDPVAAFRAEAERRGIRVDQIRTIGSEPDHGTLELRTRT